LPPDADSDYNDPSHSPTEKEKEDALARIGWADGGGRAGGPADDESDDSGNGGDPTGGCGQADGVCNNDRQGGEVHDNRDQLG